MDYRTVITFTFSLGIVGMALWGWQLVRKMKAAIADVNRAASIFKTLFESESDPEKIPKPDHPLARRYLRLVQTGRLETEPFILAAEEELVQYDGLFQNVSGSLTVLGLTGTFLGLVIAIGPIPHIIQTTVERTGDVLERFNNMIRDLQGPMKGMATAWIASLMGVLGTFFLRVFGLKSLDRKRLLAIRNTEETVEDVLSTHLQIFSNTLEGRISQAISGTLKSFYDKHSNVLDIHCDKLNQTIDRISEKISAVLETHRTQFDHIMTTSFRGLSEQMALLQDQSNIVRQGAEALQRCAESVRQGGEDFRTATESFRTQVTEFVKIAEPFEKLRASTEQMVGKIVDLAAQVVSQIQEMTTQLSAGEERRLNGLREATGQMAEQVREMMDRYFKEHEKLLNDLDVGIGQTLAVLRDRSREEEYRQAIENLIRLTSTVHQTDQEILSQQRSLQEVYSNWYNELQVTFREIRRLGQEVLEHQGQIDETTQMSWNGMVDLLKVGLSESGPLSQQVEAIGNTLRTLNLDRANTQIDQMRHHMMQYEELLKTINQSIRAINGRSRGSESPPPDLPWWRRVLRIYPW